MLMHELVKCGFRSKRVDMVFFAARLGVKLTIRMIIYSAVPD